MLSNNGTGSDRDIEIGLQWVIENANNYNIVAVNMSLGGSDNHNQLLDAPVYHDELTILKDMGIITLVAAGNDYYGWQALEPHKEDLLEFYQANDSSLTEEAFREYLIQENLEPYAEILEKIYKGSNIGAGVGSRANDPNVIPVGAV